MTKRVNSRTKGNAAELKIVKELKEIGFLETVSSRAESKNLDNKKIDFANLPFGLQSKKGYDSKGKWYKETLESMKELCSDINFDFFAIIHSFSGKPGRKRIETDDIVILTKKDFYHLLKNYYSGR